MQDSKSVVHALWDCAVARDVWAGSLTQLQKNVTGQANFIQLMDDMMLKLMNEELELFLVLSWIIWNQQNTFVQGGALQDPSRLVQRAMDLLEEYREAQL